MSMITYVISSSTSALISEVNVCLVAIKFTAFIVDA